MTGAPGPCPPPVLPPGWRLVVRDSVGSTNDEAKALADTGAGHGALVWARRQEAGRGRRGRPWESPAGNLYCSVLLRPDVAPDRMAELTFVVAVALARAVAATVEARVETMHDVRLKWPNDLLLDGRKLAGILLESGVTPERKVGWVIAGTGLNIEHAPVRAAFPATSLRAAGVEGVAPAELLEGYAAALEEGFERWCRSGFGPVREAWLARAWRLGEPITVRLAEEVVAGRFEDLDGTGALLLRQEDGALRRVTAGDVLSGGA